MLFLNYLLTILDIYTSLETFEAIAYALPIQVIHAAIGLDRVYVQVVYTRSGSVNNSPKRLDIGACWYKEESTEGFHPCFSLSLVELVGSAKEKRIFFSCCSPYADICRRIDAYKLYIILLTRRSKICFILHSNGRYTCECIGVILGCFANLYKTRHTCCYTRSFGKGQCIATDRF